MRPQKSSRLSVDEWEKTAVAISRLLIPHRGFFVADQFGFEQRADRLREGGVVTVALGPDRGN